MLFRQHVRPVLCLEVKAEDSCGLYVPGEMEQHQTVDPKESGFVKDQKVRCENCISFNEDESTCSYFEAMNRFPGNKMDIYVKPKGCCNAQMPK